jgi:hypothetical protein
MHANVQMQCGVEDSEVWGAVPPQVLRNGLLRSTADAESTVLLRAQPSALLA